MTEHDKPQFVEALKQTFAVYGKPIPERAVLAAWWRVLMPFSAAVIADAFEAHITESQYAPTPADIHALCKVTRLHQAASSALHLSDETKADPKVSAANLAQIRAFQRRLIRKTPTAEWAFKLLHRGTSTSGLPLTLDVIRCATDAIRSPAGRKFMLAATPELRERYLPLYRSLTMAGDDA